VIQTLTSTDTTILITALSIIGLAVAAMAGLLRKQAKL